MELGVNFSFRAGNRVEYFPTSVILRTDNPLLMALSHLRVLKYTSRFLTTSDKCECEIRVTYEIPKRISIRCEMTCI